MKKILAPIVTAALLSGSGANAETTSNLVGDDVFSIIQGTESNYHGTLSSDLLEVEENGNEKIIKLFCNLDGGNDPIVEEVREMELPQEFFDSDGKFINFNAFKTYLSDRWDPNMRTYASDNVYLGIGHNQFTFDFSNFPVYTDRVNEVNFNQSLIPGDFQQFTESAFLWRKLPQLDEEDYDIKIKSSYNGTIDIHWDHTQTCRNVTLTSPEGNIRTFSTTPDKLGGNFPGTYQKSISAILKKFPYFSISPDQLYKEGNFYVCQYGNHCYGPKTFHIPQDSVVIGEDWLSQAPSKDVVVDAPLNQWIDNEGYKEFYHVIARGVDVRFSDNSGNGTWKRADEVAYCYYVDKNNFNLDKDGNIVASCNLAAKIDGKQEYVNYFSQDNYDVCFVDRDERCFPLHVQDVVETPPFDKDGFTSAIKDNLYFDGDQKKISVRDPSKICQDFSLEKGFTLGTCENGTLHVAVNVNGQDTPVDVEVDVTTIAQPWYDTLRNDPTFQNNLNIDTTTHSTADTTVVYDAWFYLSQQDTLIDTLYSFTGISCTYQQALKKKIADCQKALSDRRKATAIEQLKTMSAMEQSLNGATSRMQPVMDHKTIGKRIPFEQDYTVLQDSLVLIGQWLDINDIELNVSEETSPLAESFRNAVNVVNNAKSVLDKFKATEKNLRDSIAKAQGTLSKRQTLGKNCTDLQTKIDEANALLVNENATVSDFETMVTNLSDAMQESGNDDPDIPTEDDIENALVELEQTPDAELGNKFASFAGLVQKLYENGGALTGNQDTRLSDVQARWNCYDRGVASQDGLSTLNIVKSKKLESEVKGADQVQQSITAFENLLKNPSASAGKIRSANSALIQACETYNDNFQQYQKTISSMNSELGIPYYDSDSHSWKISNATVLLKKNNLAGALKTVCQDNSLSVFYESSDENTYDVGSIDLTQVKEKMSLDSAYHVTLKEIQILKDTVQKALEIVKSSDTMKFAKVKQDVTILQTSLEKLQEWKEKNWSHLSDEQKVDLNCQIQNVETLLGELTDEINKIGNNNGQHENPVTSIQKLTKFDDRDVFYDYEHGELNNLDPYSQYELYDGFGKLQKNIQGVHGFNLRQYFKNGTFLILCNKKTGKCLKLIVDNGQVHTEGMNEYDFYLDLARGTDHEYIVDSAVDASNPGSDEDTLELFKKV